jgi:uncharacterized protein (DUF433 family)
MDDEPVSEHLTVRVSRRLQQELTATARRRGLAPTALARAYLDEGVRMDRYPGIVFRERAGGRRAGIAGRRLDVWQVIETLRASDGDIEETADYLRLHPDEVRTALAYAAGYPDEIEALIRANREEAERAQEAEARQRTLLGR